MNTHQKEFMKCLSRLERNEGLRQYEAYCAFLEMAFCATAKAATYNSDLKAHLEERYMKQVGRFRHTKDSADACAEAMAHLVAGLEFEVGDFLGGIHTELGGNPNTGQFFTPWHVSLMMAEMTIDPDIAKTLGGRILQMQEPACGCGCMVLALGEVLKKRGINPAFDAHFDLIDVDLRCCQASYLQCSLMGISATIHHGNSLSMETWGSWHTLTAMLHPKWSRIRAQRLEDAGEPPDQISELPDTAVNAAPALSTDDPQLSIQQLSLDF